MTLLTRLKTWFKRDQHRHNIYHPDFQDSIEAAFVVNGVQYYRFSRETSIPWGRYMFMQTFHKEQNLRITLELLGKYLSNLKKVLNGSKGVIELGLAFQIISQIESRTALAFETDTTYRLASLIYFDDTEDLYTYDKAYNDEKKIPAWKEARSVDFFYTRPMTELLGLSDSLPADLLTFMDQQKMILEALNSGMPEQ